MATSNVTTNIVPQRVPLVDTETGMVSREWYRFFLGVYNITGQSKSDESLEDVQLAPIGIDTFDYHLSDWVETAPAINTAQGSVYEVRFEGGLITVSDPYTTPTLRINGVAGGIPFFDTANSWKTSTELTFGYNLQATANILDITNAIVRVTNNIVQPELLMDYQSTSDIRGCPTLRMIRSGDNGSSSPNFSSIGALEFVNVDSTKTEEVAAYIDVEIGDNSTSQAPAQINFGLSRSSSSASTMMSLNERGLTIGDTSPDSYNRLHVHGSFARTVPSYDITPTPLPETTNWLIIDSAATSVTLQLPSPHLYTAREFMIKTLTATQVYSTLPNVVPINGRTPDNLIMMGAAGKWVTLVSDDVNWIVMQGN